MKKLRINITIALLGVLLAISFSGCGLIDEAISECDEEQNQIFSGINIKFKNMMCFVKWKDGSEAPGLTVKMQIHKETCEGQIKGFTEIYVANRTTNDAGVWWSWYESTYTYNNKKDRVMIKYIIAEGAYDWEYDFVYRWEDVEDATGGIISTGDFVTLPINEDGS